MLLPEVEDLIFLEVHLVVVILADRVGLRHRVVKAGQKVLERHDRRLRRKVVAAALAASNQVRVARLTNIQSK